MAWWGLMLSLKYTKIISNIYFLQFIERLLFRRFFSAKYYLCIKKSFVATIRKTSSPTVEQIKGDYFCTISEKQWYTSTWGILWFLVAPLWKWNCIRCDSIFYYYDAGKIRQRLLFCPAGRLSPFRQSTAGFQAHYPHTVAGATINEKRRFSYSRPGRLPDVPHSTQQIFALFPAHNGAIARGPIPHRRPEICVSGILQTIYRPERKARNMQSISYGHIGRPEHQLCTRMATAPNTGQPRNIKNTIIWTRK